MAAGVGFEPTVPFGTIVFKTILLNQTPASRLKKNGGGGGTRT
ncbi:unnamed protein product, partial [marine sediment metagenome]